MFIQEIMNVKVFIIHTVYFCPVVHRRIRVVPAVHVIRTVYKVHFLCIAEGLEPESIVLERSPRVSHVWRMPFSTRKLRL